MRRLSKAAGQRMAAVLGAICPLAHAGLAQAQCTPSWSYYLDPVGPDRFVRCLTVHNGALYARGDWSTVAGGSANNIAVFDGATWSGAPGASGTGWPYGGSTAGNTNLVSFQNKLFAPLGGAGAILGWELGAIYSGDATGGTWTSWPSTGLWTNPNTTLNINRVWRACVHNGRLYASGSFFPPNTSGTGDRATFAVFDGASWSRMDGGYGINSSANDRVDAMISYEGSLYAGGLFGGICTGVTLCTSPSIATSNIACWTGGTWSALPNGGLNGRVSTMAIYEGDLYVGGDFTGTADGTKSLLRIARLRGGAWERVGGGLGLARPRSMAVVDDGRGRALFIGATAGVAYQVPPPTDDVVEVNGLVRWDGSRYSVVGINGDVTGITGGSAVYAMARFDGGDGEALYIGADSIRNPDDHSFFARTARWKPAAQIDTDGDGIWDDWETNGIDGDCDGDIDLPLQDMGASRLRKDIFVEVDSMLGRGLSQDAVDMLVAAFASAPVSNPDGSTGITLHIQRDDTDIAIVDFPDAIRDVHAFKSLFFGTLADRTGSNSRAILDAKARVFRYCVMGNTHSGGRSSGVAELPGNDFTVTLGSVGGGNSHAQASTFMHEIGHTLGLYHGGHQIDFLNERRYNFKPNYRSIMNYAWQFAFNRFGWKLDYSTGVLPLLDESALAESAGVFSPDPFVFGYGPLPQLFQFANTPCDWDRDNSIDGGPVAADVNAVEEGVSNPGGVLLGSHDWSRLIYNFRNTASYAEGDSTETSEEMDADMDHDYLKELTDVCAADFNADDVVDFFDYLDFVAAFDAEDPAADFNHDGTVDFFDYLDFAAALDAGCI